MRRFRVPHWVVCTYARLWKSANPQIRAAPVRWSQPCPRQQDAVVFIRGRVRSEELTDSIGRAQGGERRAAGQLFNADYAEMRAIAGCQRHRVEDADLGATALMHRDDVRLIRGNSLGSEGRAHFFATAARAMRQIAIDRLRAEIAGKRGGNADMTSLAALEDAEDVQLGLIDLLALDQALNLLETFDARLSRLMELRSLAATSLKDFGEKLGRSERTLKRD